MPKKKRGTCYIKHKKRGQHLPYNASKVPKSTAQSPAETGTGSTQENHCLDTLSCNWDTPIFLPSDPPSSSLDTSEDPACPHPTDMSSDDDFQPFRQYASFRNDTSIGDDVETLVTNSSEDTGCLLPVTVVSSKDVDVEPIDLYASLKNEIFTSGVASPFLLNPHHRNINLLELYHKGNKTAVKISVIISEDFSATVSVHRKDLSPDHELWSCLPATYTTVTAVNELLQRINKFSVCVGNPDEDLQELVPVGVGLTDSDSLSVLAYREGDFCASKGDLSYSSTIRTVQCCMLVEGARCPSCSAYRRSLRKRKYRQEQRLSKSANFDFIHSRIPHATMSYGMLQTKLKQQRNKIRSLESELDALKRTCQREIQTNGLNLGPVQSAEMSDLMATCTTEMEKSYADPNSLQRLFWEQQMKFNESGRNGMRWHPMIIRWCLYLRHRSSKAYDALRETGFIKLPSTRTLFDYSHYTESAIGYSADVIKVLQSEAEKKGMFKEKWTNYVGILFDEVKIRQDLVYDKHSGELIGYCDLDSVGNAFMDLESFLKRDHDKTRDLAKFMLIVMVRGIVTALKFPLAAFATMSITADFLFPIIWKAVHILEAVNLKVLFLTCDGASANRRFFKLHSDPGNDGPVFYTDNPHDMTRKIYFVSDVPHLLKTTRNCFSNSFSHSKTRKLWNDGKDISWGHIVKLYEDHCENNLYTPCPELSRNHVDLTAFSRMKVRLAAQVMSDSVANALEELYDESVSETVTFIRNINKFFDCLNVRNHFEGRNKRNPNLAPYENPQDERLDWLKNDFLGYLNQWKNNVNGRPNLTTSEKASMLLSHQTVTGLETSVRSITECVKYILNLGASFVLTHAFNQDPLEEHFSHHRHKGGANNNPSVYEVRNALTQIRAINAQALVPKRGNTLTVDNNMQIDNTRLPRRNVMRL
ncbi:uncharacterized protein LOC132556865 [Ylistrum balloti]|uniref:uncharacterized protein LOC132556865 n=1 Tax=Ylistrum balloti TaxID=509963 RepID=UPI002905DF2A|nr:uncharacterized protein LOC132556865 [Ylistrum balloti]